MPAFGKKGEKDIYIHTHTCGQVSTINYNIFFLTKIKLLTLNINILNLGGGSMGSAILSIPSTCLEQFKVMSCSFLSYIFIQ